MQVITKPLYLPKTDFRYLLQKLGPSLGLWRAAEIAALREQAYEDPVLDLGCGDGLITAQVLSEVEIGLDPDCEALQRAARFGIYRQLVAEPAGSAPVQPGSIATIISNSVLEHITELDDTLAAAHRILRPDGRLIFTAPAEAFNDWLAIPQASYVAWRNRHFVHLNIWSLAEWKQHLNRAGFEVEQVRPYLRRGWVTSWDLLELAQMIQVRKRRIAGAAWRNLPRDWLDGLAQRAAQIDLSAPEPGGGRLIVARKTHRDKSKN
jgi:SAM-dependent methyltransferase